MTRKFLFCFPLRLGNIIFGYIVAILAIATAGFYLYELGSAIVNDEYKSDSKKFDNFQTLESVLSLSKDYMEKILIYSYYLSYIIIATLLFFFAIILTCGAYKANRCLVGTFFVYSFFHLLFSIILIAWEVLAEDYIPLGLILLFDLLLIVCLFSVKYLMEAIRIGNIYSRPGEVFYT